MAVQIVGKANSKIARHGLNVFPLEAFGLLVGTRSPDLVQTVLPVGKTMHYYDTSDRFLGIHQAMNAAAGMLADRGLEILGVYHTFAGGHPDINYSEVNPICQVPNELRDCLVIVRPLFGGETFWATFLYAFTDNGGWSEVETITVRHHNIDPQLNPKRIHREWLTIWGQIDYSSN